MLINIAKPTLSEKMLNSTHLTDKVEFTAQRHDVLGSIKILIMKSFIRWNIQIETSMWKSSACLLCWQVPIDTIMSLLESIRVIPFEIALTQYLIFQKILLGWYFEKIHVQNNHLIEFSDWLLIRAILWKAFLSRPVQKTQYWAIHCQAHMKSKLWS